MPSFRSSADTVTSSAPSSETAPSAATVAMRTTLAFAWLLEPPFEPAFVVVGMLIDIFSAIVILTPLLVPVAAGFGVHPVHLGVVMLANLQLGYFTPPVGMNLFVAAYRFGAPIPTLVRACVPFFLILGAAVALITWWPWLSLALL